MDNCLRFLGSFCKDNYRLNKDNIELINKRKSSYLSISKINKTGKEATALSNAGIRSFQKDFFCYGRCFSFDKFLIIIVCLYLERSILQKKI